MENKYLKKIDNNINKYLFDNNLIYQFNIIIKIMLI